MYRVHTVGKAIQAQIGYINFKKVKACQTYPRPNLKVSFMGDSLFWSLIHQWPNWGWRGIFNW